MFIQARVGADGAASTAQETSTQNAEGVFELRAGSKLKVVVHKGTNDLNLNELVGDTNDLVTWFTVTKVGY